VGIDGSIIGELLLVREIQKQTTTFCIENCVCLLFCSQ
jgi:hypothetical protein